MLGEVLLSMHYSSCYNLRLNNFRVVHPESGRFLEVYSNQPGVQFYTANNFPKHAGGMTIDGEGGKSYTLRKQCGIEAKIHVHMYSAYFFLHSSSTLDITQHDTWPLEQS